MISNETELLDGSRGNRVPGKFRNASNSLSPPLSLQIPITSETRFSGNPLQWKPPGDVSISSSLLVLRSSPRRKFASIKTKIRILTASMIFLLHMSSNSEVISSRESLDSSLSSKTCIFTTRCFRVCIDGHRMSERPGCLTSRGSLTRTSGKAKFSYGPYSVLLTSGALHSS